MSRSKKKAAKAKGVRKSNEQAVAVEPVTQVAHEKPVIRAIRVTKSILDAAKEYKKDKGVSFYRLGLEAISEVLKREGYLKTADA